MGHSVGRMCIKSRDQSGQEHSLNLSMIRNHARRVLNHRTEQFVMAVTQLDKGNSFRALHQGTRAFVIANVWDAGSARVLAGLGFLALAPSTRAAAWASGTPDGR